MSSTPHNAYPKRHAGHDKYSSTRRKTSRLPRVTFAHVQLHRCVLAARARLSRSRLGERVFSLFTRARAPRAIATRRTNERDGCETMRSSAAGDRRANDYIIIPSLVRRARRRVVARGVKTRDDDAVIFSRSRARRPTHESIAPPGRPDRSRARAVRVIHPREIGCFCILYARESAVVRARD